MSADAADVALAAIAALQDAGLDCALGGALALAFHAEPRATKDADINVFVDPSEARHALEALQASGFELDLEAAAVSAIERGDSVAWYQGVRLDLFFNSIPLHQSAAQRLVTVVIQGQEIQILAAEDLIVLKAMFDRGKDWLDIEKMVALGQRGLDLMYIEHQLDDHVGPDDSRLARWRGVLSEFVPNDQ